MDTRDEIMRRLADGEWLRPGETAVILNVSRRMIHNMIKTGRLAAVPYLGGKQRIIDPESIRRCLPPPRKPEHQG